MSINQLTQIRLPDGKVIALTDWEHIPLWSTCDLLSGFTDSEVRTFTYSVGDVVARSGNITTEREATDRETNMVNAGEVQSQEEFLAFGMAIEPYRIEGTADGFTFNTISYLSDPGLPYPTAPLLATLHMRLLAVLEVSKKDYFQGGLGYFNAGFGPVMSQSPTQTRTYASQGLPTHEAEHMAQIPVHLGATEKFHVSIRNPGGDAVLFPSDAGVNVANAYVILRIYLNGLRKRATG